MKIRKLLLLLVLIGTSVQLVSQVSQVSIDLRNKSVKLDTKFYPANKTGKVPTVILLHGFPGNQSSPLGLAEKLNNAGFNILVFNYQGCKAVINSALVLSWQTFQISMDCISRII